MRWARKDRQLVAEQQVLRYEIAAIADGRAEQREEEQHVLDHWQHDCRRHRIRLARLFGPDNWYEDIRNHAFIGVFLATGLRFKEVLGMTKTGLDRITGEFKVVAKGGVERQVCLSPGAMRLVRRWLSVRKAAEGVGALWTTEDGQPFKYWAAQLMIQRLKKRTGIKRLYAHLLRHTFGQNAIRQGAERALVQDLMGHKTDAMTRRYTSSARQSTTAALTPRYAMV